MLTLERLKEHLHYDPETGAWTRLKGVKGYAAGSRVGCRWKVGKKEYYQIRVDGVNYYAHRLAWFYMTGEWPEVMVDHDDTNGLNNKWSNLRLATRKQNQRNRGANKNNSNGLKGIWYHKPRKKWYAGITVDLKPIHLGVFDCPAAAHFAYQVAAAIHHGEFARAA